MSDSVIHFSRNRAPRDGCCGSDVRRTIALDLIIARRSVAAFILLPIASAFAVDVGFERMWATVATCGFITAIAQLMQNSFDDTYKLRRLYGSVGVPRRAVADARWLEALAMFGAGALLLGLLGVVLDDPVGAGASIAMLCWLTAVGVPVCLCVASAHLAWAWLLCAGPGIALYIGALYGAGHRPLAMAPPAVIGLAAVACAGFMIASRAVARYWYGRQDH